MNMNFQEQIQQIFGTTDIYELKQISRDADNYRCLKADMNNSSISEKKKNTGRKNFGGNIYCSDVDLSVVPFLSAVSSAVSFNGIISSFE